MSHHIVEAQNISFTYPDGPQVLKNVSFSIAHGESVGIIGANGAGKSTLLSMLLGILFPSSGEIRVGDITVTRKTLPIIRQTAGMVFQDPDDQLFMPTVYDDVAFGPRNYLLDEQEVERRVITALETVGILNLKDRPPFKLSGGEKRAAAIATVLAMEPAILVMDEPTTALDPKARRRVMAMLRGFTHTKIITSHDMDMVFELCERTIVISEGQIVADGSTREILVNANLLDEWSLGLPLSVEHCPRCGMRQI